MRPLHRQFLLLAGIALLALKAKVPGDVPEHHEDNTFGLPNGDPLRKNLRRFFREQLKVTVGYLDKLGADLPEKFLPLADYDDAMASAMTPILSVYWSKAGKALRGRLGLDPEEWRVTDPKLHQAIADQAMEFCASTNATTDLELTAALSQLRQELQQGLVEQGDSIPQLVKRVRKVFTRATKSRAVAIARTEAARAVHTAALRSAEESGVVAAKKWLTSANSCPLCHRLADEVGTIDLDKNFAVVGKSQVYSQIRTPPAHPHCRCTMTFVLKEGDDPVPAFVHPPRPEPTPEPEPESTPVVADAFPSDPNALKVVKKLGGSTGAELVEDAQGNRFVRKRGANADHLRSEVMADEIYRSFGVPVPECKLYETKKGPVKLAKFVEGRTLAEVLRADPALARAAEAKLADHFAVDALLGNWDVVGMSYDNVLIATDGTPYRIDNGGSLDYRAQGAKKTAAEWNANPADLWTIRNPKTNPSASAVFGKVDFDQWSAQVLALARGDVEFPESVDAILRERLAQMTDLADVGGTLRADRFKPGYCDDFARHTSGLRAAGISAKLPTSMSRRDVGSGDDLDKVQVFDENGKLWDHLRGKGSLAEDFDRYLTEVGGNPGAVAFWKSQQASDSWNGGPQALKAFLASERAMDASDLWWKEGVKTAQAHLDKAVKKVGAEAYRTGVIAQHAYTHELLAKASFEGKDSAGVIQLVRTENKDVMTTNKLKVGAKSAIIKRGMAESCSIYRRVSVFGTELTVQQVPLHRIMGTYWQARSGTDSSASFLGNYENEFVALLDGIPFNYQAKMPRPGETVVIPSPGEPKTKKPTAKAKPKKKGP